MGGGNCCKHRCRVRAEGLPERFAGRERNCRRRRGTRGGGRPRLAQVDWASVATRARAELILLSGARELLAAHQAAIPQRDDLCGAFCGALALRAAPGAGASPVEGARGPRGAAGAVEATDQDAVALAARSVVSRLVDSGHLPKGERSRRDYRLTLPLIEDGSRSG